jgi:hypothetical protein
MKDMAVTDYNTACGDLAQRFIQMLANCIVGYQDISGVTHYRLNVTSWQNACTELTDLVDCDISHIEAERLLAENLFGLDDCSRLTFKKFDNTDNDWEDYGECVEMPMSLFQMLARSIVVYASGTKLNTILDTAACTSLTQLLDCDTNNIESERLLVNNIFAKDDCDKFLVKLISDTSTMTDYSTECVDMPQSLIQLLARCIVLYDGHYRLNVANVAGYCDDLLDFWTCDNGHITPERALAENIFATDSCGNLAVKIFTNSGQEDEQ